MVETTGEKPNQEPNKASQLKQIRTFQGDVADALARQEESLVSIQRAEHIKHGNPVSAREGRKGHAFSLILGSLLLIVLGAAGAWYAFEEFQKGTSTPISTAPSNRFISANTETSLVFTTPSRDSLILDIRTMLESIPPGTLHHILLKKEVAGADPQTLTTSEFLSALESHAPSSLVRAFDPLFMFGALGESAFIIIKLASFENTFAGMLAWESDLTSDLGSLFATAPLVREIPAGTVFIDITDRNKDIRAIAYEDQPVLLYSFFDNNMLIITDRLETLRSVIDRLTREKLSH